MDSDLSELETISQLTQLVCGLGVINLALIGVEKITTTMKQNDISTLDTEIAKVYYQTEENSSVTEPKIKISKSREMYSFKLTNYILPNFHDKVKKSRRDWNYKNDNSLDW